MSFQALEEAFERQMLTISTLRKFRKEHLQNLCKAKCIKISHNGKKEEYVQALFNGVSGYRFSDIIAKESNIRNIRILASLRSPENEGRGDALLGMMEVC